jgi:hypothetical protein
MLLATAFKNCICAHSLLQKQRLDDTK